MRSLWFVSLTFLLFLAACGRSTTSRSIKQNEGNQAPIAEDGNSGSVKNYTLEPIQTAPSTTQGAPSLLQATPHKFTVNTEDQTITFTADLKVDGKDLGLVEFTGTIDQKEHLAHLQSKNRDTQATVLCLDLDKCLDSAVVIYHRYKNKNLEVQFRTKNVTPTLIAPTPIAEDEDEVIARLSPLKP